MCSVLVLLFASVLSLMQYFRAPSLAAFAALSVAILQVRCSSCLCCGCRFYSYCWLCLHVLALVFALAPYLCVYCELVFLILRV